MAHQLNAVNEKDVDNASDYDNQAVLNQFQVELLPRSAREVEGQRKLNNNRLKRQVNKPIGTIYRREVNSQRDSENYGEQRMLNQHLDPLNEFSEYTINQVKARIFQSNQGRQSDRYQRNQKREKGIKTQRDLRQSVVVQVRKRSEGSKYFQENRIKSELRQVNAKKRQIDQRQLRAMLSEAKKLQSRIQNMKNEEIDYQRRIFGLRLQQREIKDRFQQLSQQQKEIIAQIQGLRTKKKDISKEVSDLRIQCQLLKDQIERFVGKKQRLLREEKEREERFSKAEKEREERFSKAEKERKERLLILERKYEQSFANFQNEQRDWKQQIEKKKRELEELHHQCSLKRQCLKVLSEKEGRKEGEQTKNLSQRSQSIKKASWH